MNPRTTIPLSIALLVGLAAFYLWRSQPQTIEDPPPQTEQAPLAPAPRLSDLAPLPDWSDLDPWQETVSREEFITMMDSVFTVSADWRDWFIVGEDSVEVKTGDPDNPYRLRFANTREAMIGPRYWRPASELEPAPADQPLKGLRIAIDPGHIGGRWAKVEERWFQVGDGEPVREGNMTLQVAELLKPKLEKLGAEVSLLRTENEPVTAYRPESLLDEARASNPESPQRLAERLFYRTAEIRARADKVNQELKPDLVLCLHFNAESWGDPTVPRLVPGNHFHLLLNGAYTRGEVELADQRLEILRKIVERIHPEEAALAESIASAFVEQTQLPPYLYESNSSRAVNIAGNPYLWARNLLANRLYRCPVVFLEPYVMNSVEDHARIQAGDYEGLREVAGKKRSSIFQEYAVAVAAGLEDYYRKERAR
ncbi:N-acetylmuramoyl-L-alanine amidase family protein [Haloferula sp.]|uniref:N-acetylmuramoyl-L-alanine amidase family protein n=1 Tax=Haloferula sp. TaxID=2497595 RepID=UPI003C720371